MTLAQEYLQLVLDDDAGTPVSGGAYLNYGLAGAVIAELAIEGRVRMAPKRTVLSSAAIEVVDPSPLGDPVLDATLRDLAADKPRSPHTLLGRLARDIRPRVVDQLVDAGILRREEGRIFGFVPRETWPATSTRREREVREQLREVLVVGRAPDERTAALIVLLSVTHALGPVMKGEDRRKVASRARQITKDDWGAAPAREVVVATATAITGIMTATATAGA